VLDGFFVPVQDRNMQNAVRLTLKNTKTGKIAYAVVRALPHDPKPTVGSKGAKFGWPSTEIMAVEQSA